ncbi:MAG: hypothetical protein ABIG89_05385 [Candidatus Woesearchaeota archaeon]
MRKGKKNRIRKNKKGFELSINFIVMMILALVTLGVGFFFAKNIFSHTIDIGEQLDAQTKTQIESKLRDPASLVAVGLNRKVITRGDHDTFGIGVANRNSKKGYFYLEVSCKLGNFKNKEGVNEDLPVLCQEEETCCSKWIQAEKKGENLFRIDVGELNPTGFDVGTLFFNIDKKAKPGLYVYDVQAKRTDAKMGEQGKQSYDSVKKIYVEVP